MQTIKKIQILKKIRAKFILRLNSNGLCSYIQDTGYSRYVLDLFTLDNAQRYANSSFDSLNWYFWWKTNINPDNPSKVNDSTEFDFDNRLFFIDWMISKYTKRLGFLGRLYYRKILNS